jgi:hypothetical protein
MYTYVAAYISGMLPKPISDNAAVNAASHRSLCTVQISVVHSRKHRQAEL